MKARVAIPLLIFLSGCGQKERKPFVEPTGLLLYLTIISFLIAVLCGIFVLFSQKDNNRVAAAGVGIVFLLVALGLLFSAN